MMAANEKGCCKKSDSRKGGCKLPEKSSGQVEKRSCHDEDEKSCAMQNEPTCICICYFQFAAPDQIGTKLQFGIADIQQLLSIYLQENWKDPQLALPWQPPDMMC